MTDVRSPYTVLDLDADRPTSMPRRHRTTMTVSARLPAPVGLAAHEAAAREGGNVNAWLGRIIRRELDGLERLPVDCRLWLVKQAQQCGCPGDPDQALVLVLRHLADRWPHGARLR